MACRDARWVRFIRLRTLWSVRPRAHVADLEDFAAFYRTLSDSEQQEFEQEAELASRSQRVRDLREARRQLKMDLMCHGG
ncbi:protein UL30A [Human betaherpesvirus 5]|uniref:Protein UL30A n=3 Tax=Human cytomegalovirus TaxID=10359 RepID=U3KRG9_HCMVM|nr:protein UL30A [Human betaherpesvirus 5]AVT50424.1 protein UL30A [synthetic human betaherpesvirus 5]WNA12730.1 protein UL30A [Cytomegalovirus humanbeta5]AGL13510.1 protein UL30A [Human betaherpesvirus 5]AGL39519.1 protein UL30A [Human betaherpesvirus 5]AGL39522.1 protein UL30A [Human betaherpesvirus 5]